MQPYVQQWNSTLIKQVGMMFALSSKFTKYMCSFKKYERYDMRNLLKIKKKKNQS